MRNGHDRHKRRLDGSFDSEKIIPICLNSHTTLDHAKLSQGRNERYSTVHNWEGIILVLGDGENSITGVSCKIRILGSAKSLKTYSWVGKFGLVPLS